ncbi:MAG TPA: hypothetical protein VG722_07450, partial [Tepidisphaeraceae bacterium]|nr:hypothetical protein [Tepidisphaeraceae bacterium]
QPGANTVVNEICEQAMTRMQQPIQVKPSNNIYTALAAAALVACIVALIVMIVRAQTIFGAGMF